MKNSLRARMKAGKEANTSIEETKIPLWKQYIMSIKDVDKYNRFITQKPSSAIFYIFILVVLLVLVSTLMGTYKYDKELVKEATDVKVYIIENIPNINLTDGILTVNNDEELIIENEDRFLNIVIVNTKEGITPEEVKKYSDEKIGQNTGIIILRDSIVYKENAAGEYRETTYKSLANTYGLPETMDRDTLISKINDQDLEEFFKNFDMNMIKAGLILYGMNYLMEIGLEIVLLAVVGYLTGKIFRLIITLSDGYKIAIHALTLPITLLIIYTIVNGFTDFVIDGFTPVYLIISYIYVVVALILMRDDTASAEKAVERMQKEEEKLKEKIEKKREKDKERKEKKEEKNKKKKESKENKENKDENKEEKTDNNDNLELEGN